LLVDGAIVTRGYLNDVEKTRASFIENPAWLHEETVQSDERRRRLYKTGDLVKYSADGSLIFVGRVNESQVKLNGQRIEVCIHLAPDFAQILEPSSYNISRIYVRAWL
jgi:non-ribosomal peptide synthetase component F